MKWQGFTLIDLIIGLAACATIAFVGMFLLLPANNWVFIIERRGGITETRLAAIRLLKEIERIKAPGQITVFTPTHIAFTDIDDQTVDFEKVGTDIFRNNTNILSRRVQALVFEYLAGDGSQALLASDIRTIRFELAITSGTQTVRLKSAGRIRNGVTP